MTNNPRYTLGTEANRIFMASETYELLKFGKGFPAPDGGSGWLNADGTLDPSHGVETWITSRMAHVYSIGAMLGYPGAGELADAALRGLTGILHDDEHGGWYPQVFADGTHAPGKVCYAHAFVILAASSALLAGRPVPRNCLTRRLPRMTSISGMTKSVWPSIPGTPNSPSSTRTVVSTPTCTPPRHS